VSRLHGTFLSHLTKPAPVLSIRGRASADFEPYASSTTGHKASWATGKPDSTAHTFRILCICGQICGRLRYICSCAPLVNETARAKSTCYMPNQAMIFLRPFSGPGSKRQSAEDTEAAADDRCLAAPLQFFIAVVSILSHRSHIKSLRLFLALAIS